MSDDRPSSPFDLFDRIGGTARALGAVVALASGIVGLIFLLRGSGTPDIKADLKALELTPNVRARAFLAETDQPADQYTQQQLRAVGSIVRLRVQVSGLEGKQAALTWSLYRARPSPARLVDDSRLIRQAATTVTPLAKNFRGIATVWIPLPPLAGPFLAELDLVYKNSTLAYARTTAFAGIGISPPPVKPPPPLPPPPPPTHTETNVTTSTTTSTTLPEPPTPPPPPPSPPPEPIVHLPAVVTPASG
jgi:hypothetical protein